MLWAWEREGRQRGQSASWRWWRIECLSAGTDNKRSKMKTFKWKKLQKSAVGKSYKQPAEGASVGALPYNLWTFSVFHIAPPGNRPPHIFSHNMYIHIAYMHKPDQLRCLISHTYVNASRCSFSVVHQVHVTTQ